MVKWEMHGEGCMHGNGEAGGMCGRRHVWQGGMCVCVGRGVYMAGGHAGVCVVGACVAGGGACVAVGACVAGEMTTAADSAHPTGMHSCLFKSCWTPSYVLSGKKNHA